MFVNIETITEKIRKTKSLLVYLENDEYKKKLNEIISMLEDRINTSTKENIPHIELEIEGEIMFQIIEELYDRVATN